MSRALAGSVHWLRVKRENRPGLDVIERCHRKMVNWTPGRRAGLRGTGIPSRRLGTTSVLDKSYLSWVPSSVGCWCLAEAMGTQCPVPCSICGICPGPRVQKWGQQAIGYHPCHRHSFSSFHTWDQQICKSAKNQIWPTSCVWIACELKRFFLGDLELELKGEWYHDVNLYEIKN